jgi:hypothetical protein
MKYALIENGVLVGMTTTPSEGQETLEIPESWGDSQYTLVDGALVQKTSDEVQAEQDAYVLSRAWGSLRGHRNGNLMDTDALVSPDRPEVTGAVAYRKAMRDLPSTYDDTTILSHNLPPSFEEWLATQ